MWTLYEYETGEFKLPESTETGMIYGGCNCGNCHITISSNGDIMACRRVTDSKVANGTSGNFYGADPQCWKTRNEITGEVLEE